MMFLPSLLLSFASLAYAQYSATYEYSPSGLPNQTEEGQQGTNRCGTENSQSSMCQTAHINSLDSFCLWAPPTGPTEIGESERYEVAWCTDAGWGTRTIPEGTIKGAHWIQTPEYVQITGYGDFTTMNIQSGDGGGELDPHGADGNGNPIGGLFFSDAFGGQMQQIHEWTNFMSATEFCVRACNPSDGNAWLRCNHIYDVMGCAWNMPGEYGAGFDTCQGDSTEPMGVYGGSTFRQGQGNTPAPHQAGASSQCQQQATLSPSSVDANALSESTSSSVAFSSASSVGSVASFNSGFSSAISSASAQSSQSTPAARSSATVSISIAQVESADQSSAADSARLGWMVAFAAIGLGIRAIAY